MIPQKKEIKKKARELVSKFQAISGHKRFSIAYTIIAVEEIISQWEYIYTYIGNGIGKLNPNLKYWQDVRKELKKM